VEWRRESKTVGHVEPDSGGKGNRTTESRQGKDETQRQYDSYEGQNKKSESSALSIRESGVTVETGRAEWPSMVDFMQELGAKDRAMHEQKRRTITSYMEACDKKSRD